MSMRIRDIRIAQGKTLDDLAGETGLRRSTLSEIETGKRSLRAQHLRAIALGLGLSVKALRKKLDGDLVRPSSDQPSASSAPAMVGERLRSLRKNRRLSQRQLARAIEVTPQAINNWESGRTRPKIEIAERIIDEFGVTLDYFLLGRS